MSNRSVLAFTLFSVIGMALGAQAQAQGKEAAIAPEILQVMKEELLDTITLEGPAYFGKPDGSHARAEAGTYRVQRIDRTLLRLVPAKGDGPLEIRALATHHQDDIPVPIALLVPETDRALHLVLLLPGGEGVEAIGSYYAVRRRIDPPALLSATQLHEALHRKLSNQPQGENAPALRTEPGQ